MPPLPPSSFPAHPPAELAMLMLASQPDRTEDPMVNAGTCSAANICDGVMSCPLPESSQLAGPGCLEDAESFAGLVCLISNCFGDEIAKA